MRKGVAQPYDLCKLRGVTFKNPIDQFISELGGTSAVARELGGCRPSVVSAWRIKGRVPRWRIAPLVDLAVRKGVAFPQDLAA